MGKQSRRSFVGVAVFLWVFFSLSAGNPLWGAEKKSSDAKQTINAEREKAIQEGVLAAERKVVSGGAEATKKEVRMPGKETMELPVEEAPAFFLAEDIHWDSSEDKASLEIVGEEDTLPAGSFDTSLDGRSIRWRPEQTLVVMKRKNNPVASPFLQKVILMEEPAMTRKLGLEAPYYALREIVLTFSTPVSYKAAQEGARISIEFSPSKKVEVPEEKEAGPKQPLEIPMPVTSSPKDMLGTFFQTKDMYEAYVTGGGRAGEVMKAMRAEKRPSEGIFDGRGGFPKDVTPVFKEAYPVFGTPEYWKKHVRAVLGQTFGYSSDFDGNYGSWGGTSCKDGAFTLQPDVDVMYNGLGFGKPFYGRKTPTGSLDFGYKARRMFPPGSNYLHFGDGGRMQTINWGASYLPQKRYSLASQNTIDLFANKTIGSSSGDWIRQPTHGYRMTNAASFNYRLTKRLLWKNGVGLERTWSNDPSGQSRDKTGYLSTGLEQVFTRRLSMETTYGYRHIFKDTDPFVSPNFVNGQPNLQTKGKDLHSLSGDVRYTISKRLLLNGGPEFDMIDGNLFKFGGHARLSYQWRPKDRFQAEYGSGVVQDGTGKLFAGLTQRGINSSTKIDLFRGDRIQLNYIHDLKSGDLSLSFGYLKTVPLSGVYGGQDTNDDGFDLQASWRHRLRGGRIWLELTYRFSTYRAKAVDPLETTDVSVKENAVFFIIRNYFGEWGG